MKSMTPNTPVAVVSTIRLYTLDALAEARPIGYFLLQTGPNEYLLAAGNYVNEQWVFAYATQVGKTWPRGLFVAQDKPAGTLPVVPPEVYPPHPALIARCDLPEADHKLLMEDLDLFLTSVEDVELVEDKPAPKVRRKAVMTAKAAATAR